MGRARSIVSLLAAALAVAGAATAQPYKPLAHFSGQEGEPVAGLIRGSDGAYYGTTLSGGKYGLGSVYKLTPRGKVAVQQLGQLLTTDPLAALAQFRIEASTGL